MNKFKIGDLVKFKQTEYYAHSNLICILLEKKNNSIGEYCILRVAPVIFTDEFPNCHLRYLEWSYNHFINLSNET